MSYRPAISQADCRKAGPYQLPFDKGLYGGSHAGGQPSALQPIFRYDTVENV